ncbi:MAG: CBS domain-containing protein [Bacteroidota bacterium]
MITVKRLLERKGKGSAVWSIEPSASVYKALELMAIKNIGALLVMEEDELVGIFSERDYARKLILKGKSSKETLISELMTKNVITVDLTTTMRDCMVIMSQKHIRHIPVIQEGEVVGIITIRDVVTEIISDQQQTIQELERYISGGYGG